MFTVVAGVEIMRYWRTSWPTRKLHEMSHRPTDAQNWRRRRYAAQGISSIPQSDDMGAGYRWSSEAWSALYFHRKISLLRPGSSCESARRRDARILCRWRSCLERSSCGRHFSTFSTHFPKTFKTASLLTLLSWPCPLNYLFFLIAWSLC